MAGFDFFYALFDEEIDRREGLHSIVTQFGVRGAFLGARLSHVATVAKYCVDRRWKDSVAP